MKRLRIFLLPLRKCQSIAGLPQHIPYTNWHAWVERGTVKVKCQEHKTTSSTRARTRTARSAVQQTAPPLCRAKLTITVIVVKACGANVINSKRVQVVRVLYSFTLLEYNRYLSCKGPLSPEPSSASFKNMRGRKRILKTLKVNKSNSSVAFNPENRKVNQLFWKTSVN